MLRWFLLAALLVLVPTSLTGAAWTHKNERYAESYPGADFSDQVQAAQDASPGGAITILINESHTMTGTIDLDQPDTTIICKPGVTITQGGTVH